MRETADFDLQDFEDVESTKGVYAKFFFMPCKNEAESAKEGRPVYVEKEYIEIIAAGNSNNIVVRPVSDMDRRRFRVAYAKFKEGDNEQIVGTPLIELPWLSRSQVEELAYQKVRTLEQLAELNDQVCMNIPGMFNLKRKAADWLKKAAEEAPFTKLHEELEALRSELAAMKAQKVKG